MKNMLTEQQERTLQEIETYIETELVDSPPVSQKKWDKLLCLLVGERLDGPVVWRFREEMWEDNDPIEELASDFCVSYNDDLPAFSSFLSDSTEDGEPVARSFLYWLLHEYADQLIVKYRKTVYLESFVYGIPNDQDSIEQKITKQFLADNSDPKDFNVPDAFEKDTRERCANPVQYTKREIVSYALFSIIRKMEGEDWEKKIKYKQPGLQLFSHLLCSRYYEDKQEQSLGEALYQNTLQYVSALHESEPDFSAVRYMESKHEAAAEKHAHKFGLWKKACKRTKDFSHNRFEVTRKGLELVANAWLAPLDKFAVSEICGVSNAYADQLLSRYKNGFLKEIFTTVQNYQEDKDI